MSSPTARTLDWLRKAGYLADVAEKWIEVTKQRKDLFGFIDVVAIGGGEQGVLAVQSTSASNHASRVTKILGIAADFGTTTEEYKPVSVVEQFLDDLKKHGTPKKPCDLTRARCLMQLAAKHHEYMKAQCNGTWPYTRMNATADGGHPLEVRECRDSIQEVAKRAGASGVIFSGDPRGCTVKLTFTDGFCNDFGKEGFCVPTGEDE